jgi:hypothetical protein
VKTKARWVEQKVLRSRGRHTSSFQGPNVELPDAWPFGMGEDAFYPDGGDRGDPALCGRSVVRWPSEIGVSFPHVDSHQSRQKVGTLQAPGGKMASGKRQLRSGVTIAAWTAGSVRKRWKLVVRHRPRGCPPFVGRPRRGRLEPAHRCRRLRHGGKPRQAPVPTHEPCSPSGSLVPQRNPC